MAEQWATNQALRWGRRGEQFFIAVEVEGTLRVPIHTFLFTAEEEKSLAAALAVVHQIPQEESNGR